MNFGSRANSWNSAIRAASEVKIVAFWSDEECKEEGTYGIKDKEDLLERDCKALLAIKHYWLDEVADNRKDLPSYHALFSWGVGNIEDWGGVEVGEFHSYVSEFKSEQRCFNNDVHCSKRVVFVSLPRVGKVGIAGGIPVEFGGQSGDCNVAKRVLCGLGALQFLDLSGNSLRGGIPRELGNGVVAPCEPDKRTLSLDVSASASLGFFALALFGGFIPVIGPFVAVGAAGAGLAVSLGDLFGYGLEIDLDSYFSGCPEIYKPSDPDKIFHYRVFKSLPDEIFDRETRESIDGAVIAFELASFVSPDEDFVIKSFGEEWKFSAKAARAAGGVAGFIGAALDAKDVVSSLYKLERLEFFHEDRSQLVHLDLSENNLSGAVPAEIGNLEKLRRLFLNENMLVGSIPERAGRSGRAANDSLAVLDLSGNHFSGEVPEIFSSNLQYLDLSENRLGGNVPEGLSLSPELRYIDLSRNADSFSSMSGLTGAVPYDIVSLMELTHLNLSRNKLSGELSSDIGKREISDCLIGAYLGGPYVAPRSVCIKRTLLKNLKYFDVSHNMLYGEVPNNFKNIGGLLDLYLNNNCFHGDKPELPGSIKRFDFSSNFFDSQIGGNPGCGPCFDGTYLPVNAGGELKMDCMYLVGLRSSLNSLGSVRASNRGARVLNSWASGKIDGWEGVSLKNEKLDKSGNRVVGLDLSFMGIEGVLPSVIGYLSGLKTLDASDNRISGVLPDWLVGLGELVSLDLSDNSLTRTIWDSTGDVLFSLTGLEELSLKNNNLAGAIPESINGLTKLKVLDISNNSLTGSIPDNLDAIAGLEKLLLGNNMLSGEIPRSLGDIAYLTDLDLSHNMLSGEIPVGDSLRFTNVVRLNLSHNKLSGNLPKPLPTNTLSWIPSFGDSAGLSNLRMVRYLDLSHNFFTGPLIESVDRVGFLKLEGSVLKLNDNCLTGAVSWAIKTLSGPEVDISNNDLDYTGWQGAGGTARKECFAGGCSGGVLVDETEKNPRLVADCEVLLELLEVWSGDVLDDWGEGEISGWTGVDVSGGRVTELSLENQRVSGALPAVIGDLGGLKVLDLSGNRLWGALPREVGNLSVLEVLDLSGNSLSGALPGEVGGLSVLTNLDLSSNNLSGGLPAGLGRLGKLERLDLSGNGFSGRIPSGLGRLSSLTYLDLSDNRLSGAIRAVSGRIPAGLGRLASLEVLDLSGNRLSGAIPAGLGGLSNLERLVLSDNSLSGGIPSELGNLRALEAGGLDLRRNCLLRPVPTGVRDLGESIARLGWNLFLTPDDNPWCVPCSDGTFLPRSSTRNLIRDCFWLVEARRALHGESGVPEFSKAAGWGTAQNPDMHRWGGVGIQRGRVRSLDLSVALPPGFIASSGAASSLYRRQKLTGGIPSELASLWALESLDLSNNRFEGAIPIEFGSLSRLASLDLSRNRLSGGVPEDLGDLLELVSLDLSHNRLEGPVPEALGQPASGNKELARLFLNDNFLTGSIPDVLGNLPLVSLHLHYNCIVGATPANLFVGATPANLKVEDFKRKPNRGNCADRCSNGIYVASAGENKSLVNDCRALMAARKVWADLGSFTSQAHISNWGAGESRKIGDWGGVKVAASGGEMRVTKLELAGNGLSGGIPEELADLDALVSLDLSHNAISDPNNGLDKLAVSVDLVELDLSANGIKGQVPTSIGGLPKLRRLVLSDNELSGIIPSGPTPVPGATPLLDRLPALEHLDLSGNALKGLVPSSLSALKHLDLSGNEITGRLPGGLFEAEELSHLDLSDNQLAGALPEKLYEHSGLVYLDLSGNRFSGAVKSGFKSLSLARLDLSGNGFSGSLPGFRLAPLAPIKVPNMPQEFSDESEQPDLYIVLSGDKTQGYFSSLVYLDLSRNRFSGPIPLGYGDFADERPMERLDLSRNQLTGSLPKWIDLLQFSDSDDYERSPDSLTNPEPDTFLVSLEHNLMCTPQDYALGDLRRNNGKTAPVDIRLGNNECPEDDHASIYVPGPVLNSTYELPSASPKDLQVAWQHPAGQTGLRYIVEPLLKDTAPEGQPEGEDCQVATSNTTATITSSESCEGFDAQHYTAKITPVFAPAGSENRYYGDTARAEEKKVYLKGWQYRTVQQRTTMQAIHDSLGLENDEKIYRWDGVNQIWWSYSKTSSSKRNRTLPAGTTITIQKFPANADLNAAKLGSADSDTSVLLHHGWNVVPAGGRTTRPAGNNGAWFIDSSFISCGYGFFFGLAGVRAILRYDIENESYDIELPCDQAEETRIISSTQNPRVVCLNAPCSIAVRTRYTARSGIDEINEYDPLYILFYSYLPVSARWENGKYVPG